MKGDTVLVRHAFPKTARLSYGVVEKIKIVKGKFYVKCKGDKELFSTFIKLADKQEYNMTNKKKNETKELYIDGKRATLKMVYEVLKKELEQVAKEQFSLSSTIINDLRKLEVASKENRSYSINVIVPETKPWYKRLFGK